MQEAWDPTKEEWSKSWKNSEEQFQDESCVTDAEVTGSENQERLS